MQKILLPFLLLFPVLLVAQKVDNTVAFRNIKSHSYFRFNYENDFFTATDRNYTQGYSFEGVTPSLQHNPIGYLLPTPKAKEIQHGLALEGTGYTPKHLSRSEIQFGDRPYASALVLKSFAIATDTARQARITSGLSLGVVGPLALGMEMQVAIHEALDNIIPKGWHNQIENDVVVNYELGYEKRWVRYRNMFALHSTSAVKMGTLFTNAAVGANFVVGKINSPFSPIGNGNKFQLYLYSQPIITAVGYDATLQGGLLNNDSPYTIASKDIERLTFQYNFGVVFKLGDIYLEYSQSIITREFASGTSAQWGGVRGGVRF